jgi:hypothetical protein
VPLKAKSRRQTMRKAAAIFVAALFTLWSATAAHGYAFNQIVPDVRQPAAVSGGSALSRSSASTFHPRRNFRAVEHRSWHQSSHHSDQ